MSCHTLYVIKECATGVQHSLAVVEALNSSLLVQCLGHLLHVICIHVAVVFVSFFIVSTMCPGCRDCNVRTDQHEVGPKTLQTIIEDQFDSMQ